MALIVSRISFLSLALLLTLPNAAFAQCRSPASSARVIQTPDASIREFPWFAALRRHNYTNSYEDVFCGASVIDKNWVLTAAHCLRNPDFTFERRQNGFWEDQGGRRLEVIINTDNLSYLSDRDVFQVREIFIHNEYISHEQGNDIALVRIEPELGADISERASLPEGTFSLNLTVTGFGKPFSTAQMIPFKRPPNGGVEFFAYTNQLKRANVAQASTERCRRVYSDASIGEGQICAGRDWSDADACNGDSGGPLLAEDTSTGCMKQVGIVSWGRGCGIGGFYGVYTRISYYEPWITGIIQKTSTLTSIVPPNLPDLQKDLLRQLDDALAASKGRVKVSIPGQGPLKVGDKFGIKIETAVAGRLLVIEVDPTGDVKQIYPTAKRQKRVKANETIYLPTRDMGFDYYRVVPPQGNGRLIALVVPDSFPYESLVASQETLKKGVAPSGGILPRIPIEENDRASYLINLVYQVVGTARPGSDTARTAKDAARAANDAERLRNWGYDAFDYFY